MHVDLWQKTRWASVREMRKKEKQRIGQETELEVAEVHRRRTSSTVELPVCRGGSAAAWWLRDLEDGANERGNAWASYSPGVEAKRAGNRRH